MELTSSVHLRHVHRKLGGLLDHQAQGPPQTCKSVSLTLAKLCSDWNTLCEAALLPNFQGLWGSDSRAELTPW